VQATDVDAAGHASSEASLAYADTNVATLTAISATGVGADAGASATDFITSTGGLHLSGTLEHVLVAAQGLAETLQVNLDLGGSGMWNTVSGVTGTSWSYDASASPLADGVYVIGERVLNANGSTVSTVSSSAHEVVVSSSGTVNLNLSEVLSDTAALGNGQHLMIGSGADASGNNGVVSAVALAEGVGTGTGQWQDTSSVVVGGITYDVYHNISQTTTVADLLIQHGIAVS
jgi:hypothetical protein